MAVENWTEEYRTIGGIKQYLLHFPAGENAPVMLFLHGGPGSAESGLGYLYQRWWRGLFTVVHWDQRGSGKTLRKNPDVSKYPLSFEVMQADLEELVAYLKQHYGVRKVVLLGHSWGTALGSVYAKAHPEDVLMYVAVGQVVSMRRNEAEGFAKAWAVAEAANDQKSLDKLKRAGEYPPKKFDGPGLAKVRLVRSVLQKYGLVMAFDRKLISALMKSPVFTLADLYTLYFKAGKANRQMLDFLLEFDLERYPGDYQMPICCIHGEVDYQTVLPLAVDYFERAKAPQKQLHIIPGAGHNTMFDAPIAFATALKEAKEMLPSGRA